MVDRTLKSSYYYYSEPVQFGSNHMNPIWLAGVDCGMCLGIINQMTELLCIRRNYITIHIPYHIDNFLETRDRK